jgi:hypothetical protein
MSIRVWIVGRPDPVLYPNANWTVHPDGDLEIVRGRTNVRTVAIFSRGQWQYAEDAG